MTGWGAMEEVSDIGSDLNLELDLSTVKPNNKSGDGESTAENGSIMSTGEIFADDGKLTGAAKPYTSKTDDLVGNHPLTIMVSSNHR